MEFFKNFFLVRFHSLRKNDPKECIAELNISFVYPRRFIIYLLVSIDIDQNYFYFETITVITLGAVKILNKFYPHKSRSSHPVHIFFNEDNNFHKITRTSKYPIMNRVLQINHANISPFRIHTDNHVNFHMHMLCCRRLKVAPNF